MESERKSRWGEPSSSSSAPDTSSSAPANTDSMVSDAAQQAAAIAAKIAASLRPGVAGNELIRRNMDDEGFVKDIEVNDLRNRYVLTKASTQKQVSLVTSHISTSMMKRYSVDATDPR
jgi:hypothetical protein